ncbi:MAG: lipoate--protein ligase family protein [Nitrospirae bacterium]|nr:lipoate--protein ligase family protein [Nitrospirota bacterium]
MKDSEWRLIDSGQCEAAYNMALDEAIAISVRKGAAPPTLRFYGWLTPSVSLGSFQKIEDIDLHYCLKNNIEVVRRPTGGRGILHDDELTYSFSGRCEGIFSRGLLDTYKRLSAPFDAAFHSIGLETSVKERRASGIELTRNPLCFQSTSYGEITFMGRKLIGSAQKRWRDGFLQQGSIPYSTDREMGRAVFRNHAISGIQDANQYNRTDRTGGSGDSGSLGLRDMISGFDHASFKNLLADLFERLFSIRLVVSTPGQEETALAHLLCLEKYRDARWTEGIRRSRSYNSNEIERTYK